MFQPDGSQPQRGTPTPSWAEVPALWNDRAKGNGPSHILLKRTKSNPTSHADHLKDSPCEKDSPHKALPKRDHGPHGKTRRSQGRGSSWSSAGKPSPEGSGLGQGWARSSRRRHLARSLADSHSLPLLHAEGAQILMTKWEAVGKIL